MNTEANIQEQDFFSRTPVIALVILGLAAVWVLFPWNPSTLVLAVIVVFSLFGFKNPVWAMGALLVNTLTISSYIVGTPLVNISLRLTLLILTGFILWRSRSRVKFEVGANAKRVIIPVVILLVLSVISNLVNTSFDFAFKDFRNMLVGLLIVIFIPAVTSDVKDLKILCGIAFITVTASAIIAVFQHFQLPGSGQSTIVPGFLWRWTGQARVPGMAEDELMLSYVLSAIIPVVLAIFFVKGVAGNNKILMVSSLVLLLPALYFTYTRSALLALVLGLVALVIFLKTRIRDEFVLIAMLLVMILTQVSGILGSSYISGRSLTTQESSTVGREILFQAGVAIAVDNPLLGIGGDKFETVAPRYSRYVDASLLQWEEQTYWGFRTLGTTEIHNDFLGIWVSYGLFAVIVYLWLFFAVIGSYISSFRKSNNLFLKGLAVGMAAGLVGYGVNSFYHNCLSSFSLFWVIVGFSLAIAKLVERQEGSNMTRLSRGGKK